jgi:Carboxypeptidase regulatory-like domain/Protein of unknown function (DUF3761)
MVAVQHARRLMLALAVVLGVIAAARCGGSSGSPASSSTPTTPTAKTATLAVNNQSATARQISGNYEYSLNLTIRETGGLAGANLGTVEFTLFKDATTLERLVVDAPWPTAHLNAAASMNLVPVTLHPTSSGEPVATRIGIVVNFVDDAQKSGTATGSVDVPPPPASPNPPAQTYVLSCIVQDDSTNAPLAEALVSIATGPNAGATATSASGGLCSIGGLVAGSVTLHVTRNGYQALDRTVTLPTDSRIELKLKPVASPNPPSPNPTPNPPAPTPPTDPMICSGGTPSSTTCGTPTARCNDGTYSCSQNRSGTCSSHEGVSCWICPGALCQGLRTDGGSNGSTSNLSSLPGLTRPPRQ